MKCISKLCKTSQEHDARADCITAPAKAPTPHSRHHLSHPIILSTISSYQPIRTSNHFYCSVSHGATWLTQDAFWCAPNGLRVEGERALQKNDKMWGDTGDNTATWESTDYSCAATREVYRVSPAVCVPCAAHSNYHKVAEKQYRGTPNHGNNTRAQQNTIIMCGFIRRAHAQTHTRENEK